MIFGKNLDLGEPNDMLDHMLPLIIEAELIRSNSNNFQCPNTHPSDDI